MMLVVSTFVPIHLPTWRPLDEGRGLAQLVLAGTPHRSCHRYSSQLVIPAMTVVHMQQHLHQATGSLPTARPVLSRPAVVTRAAPSPTSMSVSLSGPGQAAEARTDTARGGVASTSVPASTYSSSPDSIKAFLEAELPRLFSEGRLSRPRYADGFRFEDPLQRQTSFQAFQTNLRLLRAAFDIKFIIHKVEAEGDSQVTSWWTMDLQPKLGLRRPHIVVTGRSFYGWNSLDGKLNYQKDVWDSLQDNQYLSSEAVAYVIRSLLNLQTTPDLEQPRYTVLRKAAEYEIRKYEGYMVAETGMPAGSKPAAGDGFNDLAGYIFGGNDRRKNMEMTAPVISTASQSGIETMQFVMEREYGEKGENLPNPRDARIQRKEVASAIVAATTFSGLPLDFEVTSAERKLRAALLLDGLKPQDGYKLARYNDPFTLPFLRRNEIIMAIDGFNF